MPYRGKIPSWGHALQEKGVPVESIGKLHYSDPKDNTGFDALHIPMMVVDGVGMVWASERRPGKRKIGTHRMLGDYGWSRRISRWWCRKSSMTFTPRKACQRSNSIPIKGIRAIRGSRRKMRSWTAKRSSTAPKNG